MHRPHLLLIGVDGLRLDVLDLDRLPALASLIEAGTSRITMPAPTISGPGWSTLLTGATHAQHGVVDNTFAHGRLHRYPDLLTRATEADPSRTTFAAAAWPPLVDPEGVGPVLRPRQDHQRVGLHRLVVRDGETDGYEAADAEVARESVDAVRADGPDLAFVYLGAVDEAGHRAGARSAAYQEAAARTDEHVTALLDAVAARASRGEAWVVALTTDHGHLDAGGHGGDEPEVAASFAAVRAFGTSAPSWPAVIAPEELTPRLLALVAP